jgi:hypothetical protein
MSDLFGAGAFVNGPELVHLVSRLALDLICAGVVIQLVYARLYRDREYVFTYYVFNVITFCLCLVLRKVTAPLGIALALFGVFGILRYRTEQIRIRDLTYLFVVIGIGVLNAVADRNVSLAELLLVDGVILAMTMVLELGPARSLEASTLMLYDQLDLLRPGNEARLREDLSVRTGLAVARVEVNRIDLLRDAAEITLYYRRVATVR